MHGNTQQNIIVYLTNSTVKMIIFPHFHQQDGVGRKKHEICEVERHAKPMTTTETP